MRLLRRFRAHLRSAAHRAISEARPPRIPPISATYVISVAVMLFMAAIGHEQS